MNPRLEARHAYPFERLARLKAGLTPPPALKHIAMSSGEPQHAPPQFLLATLRRSVDELGSLVAWQDAAHAADDRRLYQEKFEIGRAHV
jgi:N-succinyldiaminopimelate aminotransferase